MLLVETFDTTKAILWGLVGLIVLSFIMIIIVLFVFTIRGASADKKIKDAINSTRIYVIDLLDNRYDYFQLNKLCNDGTIPTDDNMNSIVRNQKAQFYRQFKEEDQIEVEKWLNDLIEKPHETTKIKDVHVMFSKSHKQVLALFEAIHVSVEDKRIYIKSIILQNSKPRTEIGANKKMSTKDNAISAIEKSDFKGFVLAFKFYYLNEESNSVKVSDALLEGLFDVVKRFSKQGRFLINEKLYSIIDIADLKLENKSQVEVLRASIMSEFKKFLGLNGFIRDVGIASAAVENRLYKANKESIFDFARLLVESVSRNPGVEFLFDSDDKTKELNSQSVDFNTTSIIDNNVFYEFTPVVKFYNKYTREFGYFASLSLTDPSLSMRELRNNCEHDGTLQDLFQIPNYKILNAFDNEVYKIQTAQGTKPKLFLNVRYADHQFFNKTFKDYVYPESEWELVLCFTEEELAKAAAVNSTVGINLNRLEKTYQLLLVLENNNEFKLPDKILAMFSYFAFDLTGVSLNNCEITNFNILSKAGKTTRYKKPIIMSGITSMSDLELLIDDGLTHFSGPIFSSRNNGVIAPVDRRLLDKINELEGK